MTRAASTKRPSLEVLGRPEGDAGGTRPIVVPPATQIAPIQQVVTTLHQLIDTLNELSKPAIGQIPAAPPPNSPLLLDAREAGRLLSVSRSKVLDLAARGTLPSIKVGGSVRIPRERLLTWIEERVATPELLTKQWLPAWARPDRDFER